MKIKTLILFFPLLLAGCYTSRDCVCPEYYSPVCGENGKTYQNPCGAECDEVDYIDGECPVYGIGVVEYSGDTLCGFYVKLYGTRYWPDTIPPGYRVHNLAVGIRYRKMNTWHSCDATDENLQELVVLEISKL